MSVPTASQPDSALTERALLIEDEVVLLLDSGELPEVAYQSALWCLCADPHGPRLTLAEAEKRQLQEAALQRCRQIVLRDLDPANRDCRFYRGPLRSICNWQRHLAFCRRIGRTPEEGFGQQVATDLRNFLTKELDDVRNGSRQSSINCSSQALLHFAQQVNLTQDDLPVGWKSLCPTQEILDAEQQRDLELTEA